ncbi:dynamin family protein [Neisseria elongata]|uniref:dynamin family protein n=1 Tax=Neisseria elongata TaxID=495 RepID=UPI000D376B21|nr:dynamin family protein [Neisseria elongata]
MDIIRLNEKIEEFVNKHGFDNDALALKREHAIQKSEEWQRTLDDLAEEGRVLKIGIIGRVKAGKSSLLNALLFDGNDILPKAATPMTAALTIMEYGEDVRAEVDFFTQKDIDEIKVKHDAYLQLLNEKIFQNKQEIEEKALAKKGKLQGLRDKVLDKFKDKDEALSAQEKQEIEEKARARAEREMKNDPSFASYDQYCRMKASGKSLGDLAQYGTISAGSVEELMSGKLNEFVGADGKFMPFTKSVTLHIPEKGLQGLQIIDTPGINDPVTSRGERTEQLLKDCDVVLLVSPSGQFLSNEDTDLIHRVTTKEGTRHAYIIASQVDSQLFGSEGQGLDNPADILQRISATLTGHARSVLAKQVGLYPTMKDTADKLGRSPVVCSSGAAFSIRQRFNEQHTWDSNLKHVWDNLKDRFPAAFADEESAKNALDQLANIEKLHGIIAEVTADKEQIFSQRRIDFENSKRTALQDYLQAWEKRIAEQVSQIENADIDELRKQEAELQCQCAAIDLTVGKVCEDLVFDIKFNLDKQLKDKLSSEMKKYNAASEGAQGTATESREVYAGRNWWTLGIFAKYKTENYQISTLQATPVRRAIEEIRVDVEDGLKHLSASYSHEWKKKVYKQIIGALREAMGDEGLDERMISRVVRNVLAHLLEAPFRLADDMPPSLKKTGQLKGNEAEEYIANAEKYVSELRTTVRNDIEAYIDTLAANLKKVDLAGDLTGNLAGELKQLVNEIENKQASLFRYQSIQKELEGLKREAV